MDGEQAPKRRTDVCPDRRVDPAGHRLGSLPGRCAPARQPLDGRGPGRLAHGRVDGVRPAGKRGLPGIAIRQRHLCECASRRRGRGRNARGGTARRRRDEPRLSRLARRAVLPALAEPELPALPRQRSPRRDRSRAAAREVRPAQPQGLEAEPDGAAASSRRARLPRTAGRPRRCARPWPAIWASSGRSRSIRTTS